MRFDPRRSYSFHYDDCRLTSREHTVGEPSVASYAYDEQGHLVSARVGGQPWLSYEYSCW